MMTYDYQQKLWYDCGISLFSTRPLREEDGTKLSCLGCKRSLVQIQSRRPSYLRVITNEFKENGLCILWSLVAINTRKWAMFTAEIVVNCGSQFLTYFKSKLSLASDRSSSSNSSLSSASFHNNLSNQHETEDLGRDYGI